ncbi:hypothetical protein CAC42_1644 [Sphaceloma murrayae]|uniref:Uncharacterized protein n=1 Tax=Sphaceloma murrayae TaxID=2082308 RepID=A0A2K1QIB2_9PEZI|nr:hypothetical protein CAC42_1644 [Sphaceloma murrayae]
MANSNVIRIRRTDAGVDDFVLVRVEQTSTKMDLQLTATDGQEPFVGMFKHDSLARLQNKSSNTSLRQWTTILRALLLQDAESLRHEAARDVELVATVGKSMQLSVRKNIEKITQRLGDLELAQDDDVEVDTVSWAAEAASKARALQETVVSLQTTLKEQGSLVEALREELANSSTKAEAERDALLVKFAALLNAKKLKIRNQQRQLARAGVDLSDELPRRRSPATSSGKKRKATDREVKEELESRGNEAEVQEPDQSDATEGEMTPEPSSVDEDENEGVDNILSNTGADVEEKPREDLDPKRSKIPPKRELPFAMSKDSSSTSRQYAAPADGDDQDETDDEL